MTREEEIEKQGTIYSDISGNYIEWGDGWQDYDDQVYVEKAFIEGAKWADKTMIEKACEWLNKNLFEVINGMHSVSVMSVKDLSLEGFIKDFKKAMEL